MAEEIKEQEQPAVHHGNTRLPFGLCMRYGIAIGDNWTPRDAWNALKGKGIAPEKVYEKLKGKKTSAKTESKAEIKTEIKAEFETIKSSLSSSAKFGGKFTQEYFNTNFDKGNEESKKLVDFVSKNGDIKYRYSSKDECGLVSGDVSLTGHPTGEGTYYPENSTFWHETFHCIDGNFWDVNNAERLKMGYGYTIPNINAGASSTVTIGENGETLKEILKSEIGELKKAKTIQKIQEEYKATVEKYAKENPEYEESQKRWEEAQEKNKSLEEAEKDARYALYEKYGLDWHTEAIESEEWKSHTNAMREKSRFSSIYAEAFVNYTKARADAEKRASREFAGVSDTLSSIDEAYGLRIGHKNSYWKKDKNHQVAEFFANFGASIQAKDKDYENLKKYFPKSVEGAHKLLSMMTQGKIKTRKQWKTEL